jgi:hypothetical protein
VTDLIEELKQIRDTEITAIREQCGFPLDDEMVTQDNPSWNQLWDYISALESTVIGQRMAMRSVAAAMSAASAARHELPSEVQPTPWRGGETPSGTRYGTSGPEKRL